MTKAIKEANIFHYSYMLKLDTYGNESQELTTCNIQVWLDSSAVFGLKTSEEEKISSNRLLKIFLEVEIGEISSSIKLTNTFKISKCK